MGWVQLVLYALQLLPAVIKAILELQQAFPLPGQGPVRMQVLKDAIASGASVSGASDKDQAKAVEVAERVTNMAVKALNASGALPKPEVPKVA